RWPETAQQILIDAEGPERGLDGPDIDLPRRRTGPRRQRSRDAGGDPRGHRGALVAGVDVGVVIHGQAAAGHEETFDVPGNQTAVWDLVDKHAGDEVPRLDVLRSALLAVRRVAALLARILLVGVDPHRVVVVAAGENVVLGHHVPAPDAACLADADRARGIEDERVLEPRDVPAGERGELDHLMPGFDLGPGQAFPPRPIDAVVARGVHAEHA